ncbi:MAG: hypothetical protein ACERKY_05780 [Anaerolineales bacterium]
MLMESASRDVPKSLRVWFVIHFVLDIIIAIPMLLVPELLLPLLGWSVVDPITSRLVGAALLGIGVESLIGRNASRDVFKAMLNLKILWASGAILGIGLGLMVGGPPIAWIFLAIFTGFLGLWSYYRVKLR